VLVAEPKVKEEIDTRVVVFRDSLAAAASSGFFCCRSKRLGCVFLNQLEGLMQLLSA
jgi:hypothetical protein